MDEPQGEDLSRSIIMLLILTVMQINSFCYANQFILFLLLNLLYKIMLDYCVPVGCVGISGKDTVVVVCVCVRGSQRTAACTHGVVAGTPLVV